MTYDDLPLIRINPAPTDAELQADRDAKHAIAVEHWFKEEEVLSTLKATAVVTTAAMVAAPVAAAAPPIVGGHGLRPNAWSLAQYIQVNYPGVSSIGGVRADALPDHPSGHAIDIMVGNLDLGDTIAADVRSQAGRFGVRYVLWRVPNHFNHVHVTVA